MRVPRTTNSHHELPLYSNLTKAFIPTGAYQLWVSDITYIPIWITDEEYHFCYLSLIMDGYTREIMGYQVGATLETYYCIYPSFRQGASARYVSILSKRGITLHMAEDRNPKDNPQVERINNTIKMKYSRESSFILFWKSGQK